jgi:hypothetical protein
MMINIHKTSMEIDGNLPLNSDKPTRRGRVSPCKCHGCSPSPAPPVVQKNDLWIQWLLSDWSKISGKMRISFWPIGLKRLLHGIYIIYATPLGTPFFSPMSLWTFQNHNIDSSRARRFQWPSNHKDHVPWMFAKSLPRMPTKSLQKHTLGI